MRAKIQETMGQAQKQFTLLEDGARRFIQGKWQHVQESRPVQTIEAAMTAIKSTYENTFRMDTWKQRAGDLGSEYSIKAFHTVGLVTQQDLAAFERKLNQLNTHINKLSPGTKKAKKSTKTSKASVPGGKKTTKSAKKSL